MIPSFYVHYKRSLNHFVKIDCGKGFKTEKSAKNFQERLLKNGIESTLEVI
jgi:hypothetical protein